MLTTTPPHTQPHPRPARAFHCHAAAHDTHGTTFRLGSRPATTPRLALRWLRSRAQDIADQLDPAAARPLQAWNHDHAEHERALHHLAHGRPYSVTAYDDATRYELTAHPTRPEPTP